MTLSEGKIGEIYSVQEIHLPFQMERRLQALGMTRYSQIPVVNRKGKGILIVKIRGTRFALGEQITKNIEVRRESHE